MPSSPGGACAAITSVIIAPQSPPCATNFLYPRRFISTTQARAMRAGSWPACLKRRIPASTGSLDRKRPMRSRHVPSDWSGDRRSSTARQPRARPPVRDDKRQCIFMLRTNVNVEPIDLGDKIRQSVQSRFALAPIVIRRPTRYRRRRHKRQRRARPTVGNGFR
jgi:hypothetical protein